MTLSIQRILQRQIETTPDTVAKLFQPDGLLYCIADKPAGTSYFIKKITTLCTARLESSWIAQSRRETSSHSYSFSQSEDNFPFFLSLLSLLPETRINEIVRQGMLKETSSLPQIEPDQLDPQTKLLYTTFTASDTDIRCQACMALFEELISQSDVPVEFSIKAVAPLMEKTLNSAFLNHPGLLRSVLESEGHNPMARTLIQRIVIARVAKIIKEKDRISRIQQVITDQLMDNQKKFANFVAEYSDPLQGKTNILQTTILDSLTSEFSLSKDKVQYTIRLKSNAVKIRLPTLPEQKV